MSFLASALLRPRADLRKRLEGWAKAAIERLQATGAETYASISTGLAGGASQWVALVRRGTKPDQAKARLILACDTDRVEVGLEIQPQALAAVRGLLADPERSLELLAAFDAMPEQFAMGVPGAAGDWPRGSSDDVRKALDLVEGAQQPLWIGWSVPRDLALAHAASLDEQLQDALVALGPLFALLDVDGRRPLAMVPGRSLGRPSRADRRDRRTADDDGDAERKPRGSDRSAARRDREQEPAGEGLRRATRPADADPEPDPEREAPPRPARTTKGQLKTTAAAVRRRSLQPRIDPSAPIDRGTLVRVLDGAFRGKVGVVQELDGKGGARVLLGLLAVRLSLEDIAPCAKGRERPLLSSSHRKPLPARS